LLVNLAMNRRTFLAALSVGSLAASSKSYGLLGSGDSKPVTARDVDAIIDQRLSAMVAADDYIRVVTADPNIVRRIPTLPDLMRKDLRDPHAVAFMEGRRVKSLVRLKAANIDPNLKKLMLDLELELVDHSVAMCMDHFVGVHDLMRSWGHGDEFANVGLFHAVYGTEFNVLDLLDYRSAPARARIRQAVGAKTERWIVLYALMTSCRFVIGTRDSGRPVKQVEFFEPTNVIGKDISEEDFHALAELQVANAYEPYTDSRDTVDLGIDTKFELLHDYLSPGAKSAIEEVTRDFPDRRTDAELGC
jgi:hypothetical protein